MAHVLSDISLWQLWSLWLADWEQPMATTEFLWIEIYCSCGLCCCRDSTLFVPVECTQCSGMNLSKYKHLLMDAVSFHLLHMHIPWHMLYIHVHNAKCSASLGQGDGVPWARLFKQLSKLQLCRIWTGDGGSTQLAAVLSSVYPSKSNTPIMRWGTPLTN